MNAVDFATRPTNANEQPVVKIRLTLTDGAGNPPQVKDITDSAITHVEFDNVGAGDGTVEVKSLDASDQVVGAVTVGFTVAATPPTDGGGDQPAPVGKLGVVIGASFT